MKLIKILSIIALVTSGVLASNAQEFGVRFGGINGSGGIGVDAAFETGQYSRFHSDIGIYKLGVGLNALWDFVDRPVSDEALNWYVGIGPSMYVGSRSWLGISGEIGLEYRFLSVPIALGIDWRPTYWLVNNTRFGADSFGINMRFVFG